MKGIVFASLLLAATGAVAQGADRVINGRVTNDDGEPLGNALIEVRGLRIPTGSDGRFQIDLATDEPVSLRVSADGHYAMMHTFAGPDLDGTEGAIGDVALVAKKPGRNLLLFTGDAMLARRYFDPPAGEPALIRKGREFPDGKKVLAPIKPYVELADYASVNLETQLSSGKLSDRLPKSITFYSPDELARLLEWAGFDYAALGNNHTWDYQAEGLKATFEALGQTGLGYSGAGFDEPSARAPHVADLDGQSFAFLSYVGWAGTFSPHQAAEGEKGGAALGGSDVFAADLAAVPARTGSVLQYHSGLEYSDAPAMSERTRLREAVDNGADVAIGHHAHILQGLEIYKNRLVAYSMGNFLFDQTYYTTQLGMLLYAWLDGEELHRVEVVPMYVNGYVPTPATGAMRYAILERLARLSEDLGTCLQANGANAVATPCNAARPAVFDLGSAQPGSGPVPLALLGARPLDPVAFALDGYRYRLGNDILRRGNFESAGDYNIPVRGWMLGDAVSIVDGESRRLEVSVSPGAPVRTGMSAFQRVFTRSNPTTLSGRVYSDGPAAIRFRLQRRRPGTTMAEALENGPLRDVGMLRFDAAGWHRFSIDFDQPRITTEAVRLLFEVATDSSQKGGVTVAFDDLTWVEWTSPWMDALGRAEDAQFATHVQFLRAP